MQITISCSKCSASFRVKAFASGSEESCPKCGCQVQVPATDPTSAEPKSSGRPPSSASTTSSPLQPSAQTTDRPQANPFAGRSPGQPAKPTESSENPYAAPSSKTLQRERDNSDMWSVERRKIDANSVFAFAWQVFKNHLGLLIAVSLTLGLISIARSAINQVAGSATDRSTIELCLAGILILSLISMFLSIGQMRIALKLCRNQETDYSELFMGGDRFLHVLGWTLLLSIPPILSLLLSYLFVFVSILVLATIFWPSYFLIIDKKTGVFESFAVGGKIGVMHLGLTCQLGLATIGVLIAGAMACGIGLFFSTAYITVLWSSAYLMIRGEIRSRF